VNARPEVVEVTDASELVEAAGRRFVETVVAAQRERGSASVVLTGGSNGIALLKWLRDNGSEIDWRLVDIWFGDDRFVPETDDERNSGQARDALLAHVDVDPDRVFTMAPSDGAFGDDITAAAADYARLLREGGDGEATPAFDVHLLGMGGEGHINSLFPHTDALAEREATVVAVENSPKPPPRRITLTVPAVNRARQVWFLVAGAEKAEAVAAGVGGGDASAWPCASVGGTEATVWFVDAAASADL
jgi:6-phosphogluconolactonase